MATLRIKIQIFPGDLIGGFHTGRCVIRHINRFTQVYKPKHRIVLEISAFLSVFSSIFR